MQVSKRAYKSRASLPHAYAYVISPLLRQYGFDTNDLYGPIRRSADESGLTQSFDVYLGMFSLKDDIKNCFPETSSRYIAAVMRNADSSPRSAESFSGSKNGTIVVNVSEEIIHQRSHSFENNSDMTKYISFNSADRECNVEDVREITKLFVSKFPKIKISIGNLDRDTFMYGDMKRPMTVPYSRNIFVLEIESDHGPQTYRNRCEKIWNDITRRVNDVNKIGIKFENLANFTVTEKL